MAPRRARARTSSAEPVRIPRKRRSGVSPRLRPRSNRDVPPLRRLCRQGPERRQPGRAAGGAGVEVRTDYQPQDRSRTRIDDPTRGPRTSRRADRVMCFVRRLAGVLLALGAIASEARDASAQTSEKIPRIGYLGTNIGPASLPPIEAFRDGLHRLGWIEGENIVVEYHWGRGRADEVAAAHAAELA